MKRDDDVEREIRAHLEMEADEHRAAGLSDDAARQAARRAFGSPMAAAEGTREMWPGIWLAVLGRNVRHALRRAARTPGFTATIAGVVALAVGAGTALFSFADITFFKSLPYPNPERLYALTVRYQSSAGPSHDNCCTGADWEALARGVTFQRTVHSGLVSNVNLAVGDRAVLVKQHRVSREFFGTLGIPPALGRTFNVDEDVPNGGPAVVISDALRQRVFGERSPIGEKILLKGEPYPVVGVMPAGFNGGEPADIWTPLRADPKGEGAGTNYTITLRLNPGVTLAEAQGELDNLSRELPPARPNSRGETFTSRFQVSPLLEGRTSELRTPLLLLLAAMGLVLLIGAVNVGGLLLARQSGRAGELATRQALGASAWQIFSEVLLDSLVLISIGGVLAAPVAYGVLAGLKALCADLFPVVDAASIDLRALAAAALLTVGSGLVAGLFPAWQSARTPPRAGTGRGVAGRSRRIPLGALVTAQVAFVVPLLVGAGLLGRSFLGLWGLAPGFDPEHVSIARFSLQESRYANRDKVDRLLREGVERMSRIPGVEAAAAGLHVPMERWLNMPVRFGAKPVPGETGETGNMNYVTPNYFAALRIPLLRGREFTEGDNAAGERVVIVNQSLVKLFLEGREPLGEYLRLGNEEPYRIVGVVGDTQQRGGWGGYGPLHPMPAFYITSGQTKDGFLGLVHQWFSPAWVVRSTLDQATLARQLETVMRELDPMLPIASLSTPAELKGQTLGMQRLTATLLSGLSALGLILCVLGVWGLVASGVAERTREIGIRLALGATPGSVIGSAMRPGLLWALAGIAIGIPLAYLGRTALSKLLYNVQVTDSVTLAAIAVLLLGAVGLASLLPALRLAGLDPAVTLRND